jgi:hypothetical protein
LYDRYTQTLKHGGTGEALKLKILAMKRAMGKAGYK